MDALQKEIEQQIKGNDSEAPLTFTLLYKATRDGFNAEQFHERCDGKGPTLTVLHGNGVLFGGYTSKSWMSSVKLEAIVDDHAFLYHREEYKNAETIFFVAENQPTITCYTTYGPTFGGTWTSAYDLEVFRTPKEVKTNFNNVFCNRAFNTKPNGGQLTVKDVEVYQVEDLEKFTLYDDIRKSVLESVKEHIMMLRHKPLFFKPLFSALRNGCSASVFHDLCDGQGPTVTLLYGKRAVYGGYSSVSWSSNTSSKLKGTDTFLFCKGAESHRRMRIYAPVNETTTLVCNQDYGPTFGEATSRTYDLQAFFGVIQTPQTGYFKSNGTANFKQTFKENEEPEDSFDEISMDMTVRDIEVFQVQETKENAWRNINLSVKKEQIVKEITEQLHRDLNGESMYNILLVGSIGAGKSSFCNTLTTAFQNKIARLAVAAASDESVTFKYRGFQFSDCKTKLPIRVFDTRGFEEQWTYGHHMNLMLNGKLRDGFEFADQPTKTEGDETQYYAKSSDMIHVVALVVDATKVKVYGSDMMNLIKAIRQSIHRQELKLVVIATRFDELDPLLRKCPDQLYRSPHALEVVDSIASILGVTSDLVIPFINYTTESKNNEVLDKIALYALKVLINEANGYRAIVRKHVEKQSSTLSDVKKILKTYLCKDTFKCLKILCVGKVCAGKSTLIDSVKSVLERKRSSRATGGLVSDEKEGDEPVTRKVMRYPLKISDSNHRVAVTNACIVDMPGFSENGSLDLEKIKMTIEGHVKNRFELVNEFSKTSESFVRDPKLKDRMHVVCIILDHESASDKAPTWEKEMVRSLLKWLSQEGIPVVVVLTKLDKFGPRLDEALSAVVDNFRINRSLVFPVQNYVHDQGLDDEKNAALLDALNSMLEKGLEYIEEYDDDDDDDDDLILLK